MSQRLRLNVDAVDDEIRDRGAGARIEIQRDTAEAFSAPTAVGNVTLVSGQEQYEFFDPTGSTTNWYRFRLAAVDGTLPSEWSAIFRGGGLQAYATLEDLREEMSFPQSAQVDNHLTDLLVQASGYLDEECGRQFYRSPQVDGTEVRVFETDGGDLLLVRAGIVSLTQVEYAYFDNDPYNVLAATDWTLYPPDRKPGMPYDGVVLTPLGNYQRWPHGFATARLTGVFGFPAVPSIVKRATMDLAREWYRQGPGGGGPVGVNQFGTPIFGGGLPLSVKQAIARYKWKAFLVD